MDAPEHDCDRVHGWVSDTLGKSPKAPVRVCDPALGFPSPQCDPEAQLPSPAQGPGSGSGKSHTELGAKEGTGTEARGLLKGPSRPIGSRKTATACG